MQGPYETVAEQDMDALKPLTVLMLANTLDKK